MKCLIVLCAHDGIVSHYTGVGTINQGYMRAIRDYARAHADFDITLQLLTPTYHPDSFGYSAESEALSREISKELHGEVVMLDNGSDGQVNYGTVYNWEYLTRSAAKHLDGLDTAGYDQVVVLYNDTPFACLSEYMTNDVMTFYWIPHSTVKIHKVDSALGRAESDYFDARLEWEERAVRAINEKSGHFLITIGQFIRRHMIDEYGVKPEKLVTLTNGAYPTEVPPLEEANGELRHYLRLVSPRKHLLISYGRAEEYKNLEYTLKLGAHLPQEDFQTIVIAQSYFSTQPILEEYRRTKANVNPDALLFIDPPFSLPEYLLELPNKKVVLIPSKAETMGLIVNELRIRQDPSVLVVVNDVDGLSEQVRDGHDAILIQADDDHMKETVEKITKNLSTEAMSALTEAGYLTYKTKYDIKENIHNFLNTEVFKI